ncbi:MAG: ABC transporter ATP-binding protein [Solirubrobacterales bacterium]|nr:ABC transporter ATP-binding protein [Solirubrobacterales bacterium]OJU95118.1 MAG: hypothetical protein BGO23_10565 [Solirubrobacterales bacterium 67-14]
MSSTGNGSKSPSVLPEDQTYDAQREPDRSDGPAAIEVQGLSKAFTIPEHRVTHLKERALTAFKRTEHRTFEALKDISFDVRKGEFFGIVGRNGSGKSTLLKILASIYRADSGTVKMAGRAAPFIELGVGFNPDLTAVDNVTLNGVMMGLSRSEARKRLDSVLEFAELEEFAELKLKNYSSGMMVRLAFATMIQADADVMLIDEVLAVGDAAFQQKCMDVFHNLRDVGKTIVLVTHDMTTVEGFCHRAMLIERGNLEFIGDPTEVCNRYLRTNFEDSLGVEAIKSAKGVPEYHTRKVDAWVENGNGERIENVEIGTSMKLKMILQAQDELVRPTLTVQVRNANSLAVFGMGVKSGDPGMPDRLAAGQKLELEADLENVLAPGRYYVRCFVTREHAGDQLGLQPIEMTSFVVFGMNDGGGVVSAPGEISVNGVSA